MKGIWWKLIAFVLVLYAVFAGLLLEVPRLPILHETIRNLYYHVPMWWTMILLYLISFVYSIKYLSSSKIEFDQAAGESVNVGLLFGGLGVITGMIWAKFTWGDFWTNDVHLNGAAITILSYTAYVILRNSFDDEQKKARFAAVYNIFSFMLMLVFIGILPRMTDSLHPGKGGNPGFNQYDLDSQMRMVFYPAVIGWFLTGLWIYRLKLRINRIEKNLTND